MKMKSFVPSFPFYNKKKKLCSLLLRTMRLEACTTSPPSSCILQTEVFQLTPNPQNKTKKKKKGKEIQSGEQVLQYPTAYLLDWTKVEQLECLEASLYLVLDNKQTEGGLSNYYSYFTQLGWYKKHLFSDKAKICIIKFTSKQALDRQQYCSNIISG